MNPQQITVVDSGSSSTTGIGGQTVITGTPTPGSFVEVMCAGGETAVIQVAPGFVATLVVEKSLDGGTTWYLDDPLPIGETSTVVSITVLGAASVDISGFTNLRVRCTAFTSGPVVVGIVPGQVVNPQPPSQGSAPDTPTGLIVWGGAGASAPYWLPVEGATSYTLEKSADGSTWGSPITGITNNVYFDQTAGTTAATTGLVYYRVAAVNADGASAYTLPKNTSPTQFIFDNSTDVDGTLLPAHVPNVDKADNPWTNPTSGSTGPGTGVIVINGNKFACTGTVGQNGWFGIIDTGIKDYALTCSITLPATGAGGLVVRYVDNLNLTIVFLQNTTGSAGFFGIYQINAGVGTVLDSGTPAVVPGSTHQIAFTALGSKLTATVDGGTPLAATISGSYAGSLTSTQAGISFSFGIETITNFGAAPASPLPFALTDLQGDVDFTVGTWTDQTFQGNNATQATGANQFAANPSGPGGKQVVNSPDQNRLMNFPDIQPTTGNWTKVALLKSSDLTGNNILLSGDSEDGSHALGLFGGQFPASFLFPSTAELASSVGVGSPQTAWALVLNSRLYAQNFNVSMADAWLDHFHVNSLCGGISPTTEGTAVSVSKLSVGGVQGAPGSGLVGDIARVIETADMPSASDVNALAAAINTNLSLTFSKFSKQVVFVGDSITAGGIANAGQPCWAALTAAADTSRYYANKGRPGSYVTDAIADIATNIYPMTRCGVPTSGTIFFGPNDLALGGFTGTQIYNNIVTLAQGLRANGMSKIIVWTMLPYQPTYETQRLILNGLIQANWATFADGIFDTSTMPSGMGLPGANTNLTWYNADQLHPNGVGHSLLRAGFAAVATAINW